ncbi:MAG: chromosome segregation protein SMC [Proteobacteria bacterium]|nr:chromosome segregation protein SMC [Pseudomonadota bacterium]
MRLTKIKLAGFKSFVDPTTIQLISNLTAIAGPNGCGKSNVIDAVRWVMGESSAKHLRGGSLTDVIFSGTTTRKPVGQATVELLFDNNEGKLGGEYAAYSEIAIKRQVSRDGQSIYFLNGQRCRRRDITDIFLGTGLGPRSYAIIEQGMITRVIEAKPEDLRNFLEEAAGISKYKERRKETENRIQHTLDNIARLNDIRGELENQLNKLKRQSQAAEQYKILKAEESEKSAQLAALAWQRLDGQIKETDAKIRELTVKLEEEQSNAQHLKTEQEKQRLAQTDANEALNEVQKRYYSVGGEIAKIEQSIQHHQERQQQLLADKLDAEQTLLSSQSQLEQDKQSLTSLEAKIATLAPKYESANEESELCSALQLEAENAQETWRESLSKAQQDAVAPTRQAEAEKAKITQLERQIHLTQERINRLQKELSEQPITDNTELQVLDEKILIQEEQLEALSTELTDLSTQKEKLSQELSALRPQIKANQQVLNERQGQLAALKALQAQALGKDEAAKKAWFESQGILDTQYVAQLIEVKSGWELAIETVLEGYLDAVGVQSDQLLGLAKAVDSLQKSDLNLIAWTKGEVPATDDSRLLSCIKTAQAFPLGIYQLLNSVFVAQNLNEATELLQGLKPHESVITPQGYWMGQGWVKVKNPSNESEGGLIAREEKIKGTNQEVLLLNEKLEMLQLAIEGNEESLKNIELERESKQQEKSKFQQEINALQSERKIKQNKLEQIQKRNQQITREENECKEIIHTAQMEVQTSRSNLHGALDEMSRLNNEQASLQQNKQQIHDAVVIARQKAKEASNLAQQLSLELQTAKTQTQSLQSNVTRFAEQIQSAQTRVQNIILSLEKNEEPIATLREELELNLEKRIIIEDQLNQARDNVAAIDNVLRSLEQQLFAHEQRITQVREQLEQSKMLWQALQVRCESALEKLKNTEFTLATLLETMPADANEQVWQEMIEDLENKIQRLGAINLAAIEEYEAALQRKEYLDSQCNDLNEALVTLENAIKKIDKETRAKFQETFDKVNEGFSKLFPILFGGGQAFLQMTGEDLLETGLTLIARPPGKKNSTIQLLSGGEKALTAVALVFAIFQLNPAPFCMLDEVDAPLDDNNVGRFCNLVKEMSKSVQFIYVSHNKLAIEMAEQLQGVTMREPGVSRLVTVDIEEAKSMAQS